MNQTKWAVLLQIYQFDKDSAFFTRINKMYLAAH